MVSPDPVVQERNYYLSLLNYSVDDPSLSLATLKEMSAGAANAHLAANTSGLPGAFGIDENGSPYYDPDLSVPAGERSVPQIVDGAVVLVKNGASYPVLLAEELDAYLPIEGADARYVPRPLIPLVAPFYFAHRGGAGYAPEETMEAFRISAASGVNGLEMDLQPLGDGSLGVMHDTTVDRTTDGTGAVSSYTAPAWRALNAADYFPWNGKSVPPALFEEILNEFAGKYHLMVEPKDVSNATQLMNVADRYAIKDTLIVATSSRTVLQACKARDYKVCFIWFSTVGTPDTVTQIISDGADYLMCDSTRPDAEITQLVSTGKPVVPFTVNTRKERDRLALLGVQGYLSDQAPYLKLTTAMRTVDSWRQGVFGHGLNLSAPADASISSQALVLGPLAGAVSATVGEIGPLANATGTWTLDIDCAFVTLPADMTRAISISFGITDDGIYNHSGSPNSFPNEYRAYFRANGQISLYRVTAGNGSVFTQLGATISTAAMTAGAFAHLRVSVTPTTVRFQRTDVAGDIGAQADTTYRGGYINLSKNPADANASFKNLAIT